MLEYTAAYEAQSLQAIIGHPSTNELLECIEINMLRNCPDTKVDTLHAENILGPNLRSLKGKTTRKTPSKVIINTCDDLPKELLERHRNFTLEADIRYINGTLS